MWLELGELRPPDLLGPCWPGHHTQSTAGTAEGSLTRGPVPRGPATTGNTEPSHPVSAEMEED